ncbi:MAG TPA: sulfite exporter TauE/SafE family protein [Stellaceae bacterium]|jgi:hypothetical protein|nr:sulfite exporter TauE/SafE family protein [Stellaceae bacterium]
MGAETLCVLLGASLGGFVQGLSGFAFGLVAMPIWAWLVAPQLIGPMVVFGSIMGQLLSLGTVRSGLDWRRIWPFVLGGAIGVPIGVYVLRFLNPIVFKAAVGCLLSLYCPTLLAVRRLPQINAGGRPADAAIGWLGGIMGGIGGLTGPVPVLWCMLRGWRSDTQRAVFQCFNIAMQALALAIYAGSGMLTGEVGRHFALVLPAMLLPALLGTRLYRRVDEAAFRRVVLALLTISGLVLLAVSAPRLLR